MEALRVQSVMQECTVAQQENVYHAHDCSIRMIKARPNVFLAKMERYRTKSTQLAKNQNGRSQKIVMKSINTSTIHLMIKWNTTARLALSEHLAKVKILHGKLSLQNKDGGDLKMPETKHIHHNV